MKPNSTGSRYEVGSLAKLLPMVAAERVKAQTLCLGSRVRVPPKTGMSVLCWEHQGGNPVIIQYDRTELSSFVFVIS